MCGCSASYANMSGNEYIGLTRVPSNGYANTTGVAGNPEEKVTTTADKVGAVTEKASGILGQIKSVTDVFSGKTTSTGSTEAPASEKKDKMIYLYAAGGLLVLVAIIFAIKKLR